MRRAAPLVLAGAVAVLAAAPAAGGGPQLKTVLVEDNYYLPAKLTVNRGSTITWKWPADAGDVHDVKLGRRPSGVKVFQSEPAAAGYVFRRTLRVPGTYRIVCTLHEEMRMTITVRRS